MLLEKYMVLRLIREKFGIVGQNTWLVFTYASTFCLTHRLNSVLYRFSNIFALIWIDCCYLDRWLYMLFS